MILLADSGSTKTEWILLDEGKELAHTETIGLNPYFVKNQDVKKAIQDSELQVYTSKVKVLHFYGAGCSNLEKAQELHETFTQIFPNGDIQVKTDIEGAVKAVAKNKPCIVCILGTGSTFRIFDGNNIKKKYSSLAYILGDEGSGTYIAKSLLRGVYYEHLSKELRDDFKEEYTVTRDELLNSVYNEPLANRYLASFVPFCKKHISDPSIEKIVFEALEDFYLAHLHRRSEIKTYPVHFIGSIAFYFEDQLQQVARKHGFKIGEIVQKPLAKIKEHFI